jgi:hypothetical protein
MISTYPWKDGTRIFIPGMLLLAAMAIPPASAQQQDYDPESLFIALFANGDALVEYDVSISDPLDEEVRIILFGVTRINDLIVVDYEDELVEYEIGDAPNEIVLNTPGVPNVRISYTTPDLANRQQGIWTFAVNAATGLIVRLPPDSVLVDYEPIPAVRFVNDQPLLTFGEPGPVTVSYAIGVLGTEDQANIAIQLAGVAIAETRAEHPEIVLTAAEDLLERAIEARDDRMFGEAEGLAGQANDAAVNAGRNYVAAQSAIASADREINRAAGEGRDVAAARQLLQQAESEFAAGDYVPARNSADDAVAAISDEPPEPQIPLSVIIAAAAAAAGGIGAMVFLRMRKPPVSVPQLQRREAPKINNRPVAAVHPPEVKEPEMAEPAVEEELVTESSAPAEPGTIPESQIDRSVLGRIVSRIIEERTHLRPEDQDVLKFLAEKEGAAFESEVRTKFQLPKTTIWRLVKRLEREELVEIRKAGGQNLIKLKFEDKMP